MQPAARDKAVQNIYKFAKIAAVVYLLFWFFVGWDSLQYVRKDEEIGKEVVFTRQMVITDNLPKNMVRSVVLDRYSKVFWEKSGWSITDTWYPDVIVEDVPCDEVFTVKESFYIVAHGCLHSAFTGGKYKSYVLSSEQHKNAIVTESEYDAYTTPVDAVVDGNGKCIAAGE